jgi:hypothetical protein
VNNDSDAETYNAYVGKYQSRHQWMKKEVRFEGTYSSPIFIQTKFAPQNRGLENFQVKLLGGIFGIVEEFQPKDKIPMRYYWKKTDELSGFYMPPDDVPTYPIPNSYYPFLIWVYQNGDYAAAYLDGNLISETKFKGSKSGEIIFSDRQNFMNSHAIELRDTSISTGKLAWRLNEVLPQSTRVKETGINPYADKFDINLSGGINKSKERRGKNKNDVAEAQVNYQTVDLKVRITPRPDSDLTYPAFINVTYSYSYTEQWNVKHYLFGDIERQFERKDSINKQFLLESPSSVIEDTYSLEYAESVVSSDFTETAKLKLLTDPVINIDVTGLAMDP